MWRHNTQHNNIQHNNKKIGQSVLWHLMLSGTIKSTMSSVIMLSIAILYAIMLTSMVSFISWKRQQHWQWLYFLYQHNNQQKYLIYSCTAQGANPGVEHQKGKLSHRGSHLSFCLFVKVKRCKLWQYFRKLSSIITGTFEKVYKFTF
jgi:hypothetical protein